MKYFTSNLNLCIYFLLFNFFISNAQDSNVELNLGGDYFFNKGLLVFRTNIDSAIIYFTHAKSRYEEEEKWEPFINCHNALASLHYSKRDFEKYELNAIGAVNKSQLLLGESHSMHGTALSNLDVLYTEKGNYRKSIYYLLKALKIQERNNVSKTNIALTFQNLASSLTLEGEALKALDYARKALEYYQQVEQPNPLNIASVSSTIGYTFKSINKLDSAEYYYFKALNILEKKDIQKNYSWEKKIISAYQKTAEIFIQKKDATTAQKYLEKALSLQSDDKAYRKSISYEKLARVYILRKDYTNAEKAIRLAIELAILNNKKALTNLAVRETYLGDIFFLQNDFPQALKQYQSALDKLSGFTNTDSLSAASFLSKQQSLKTLHKKAETLYQLYAISGDKNHLSQSFKTYILATQLILNMRMGFQTPEAKNLLAERALPIYEASIRLALELYKSTSEKKYLEEAFQIAESNKALLLLESLNEQSAKGIAGIPDSLLNRDKDLRIDLAFYQKKIIEEKQKGGDKNKASIKQWEDQIFSIERQLGRLSEQMEKDHPKYFEMKYKNDPISITAIQQNLKGSDKAFLEYFVGEENIYLFVITGESLDIHPIEKEDLVRQNVEALRNIIYNPPSASFAKEDYTHFIRTANDLYNQLIQPALDKLNSKTTDLVIVPDYYLNYIPFDVLLSEPGNSENSSLSPLVLDYLFKDFNISYDYSVTLHFKNKSRNTQGYESDFVGFAPSFNDTKELASRSCAQDDLYSLKCSENEIQSISEITSGKTYFGQQANRQSFESDIHGYKIIHLATHACIDERNSNLNKIFLTDDYLSNFDLYNLELNAQLAVLSACNTGSGELIKGEGVLSLARGFIQAGCSSTVMSMWSVDDCATSDIMIYFYEGLKDGLSKDKALKAAKSKYLESVDKSKMHPYYWAAFVPFGDMEAVEIGGTFHLFYIILPIAFIFLLFLFVRKKF